MKHIKNSTLKQHKYSKELKIIQPPLLSISGVTTTSWLNDRLPEYLWLGLILMNFDRTEGIKIACKILEEISKINNDLIRPKFSSILSLSNTQQINIYEIICAQTAHQCLSPLTVIYRNSEYPIFNEYFNICQITFNERLNLINKAIKQYYNHQSYFATDLRYVISTMLIFQKKLHIAPNCSNVAEALQFYPFTNHDDEKMKSYRPAIRTLEMSDFEKNQNTTFVETFWAEIGLKNECQLTIIGQDDTMTEINYSEYIKEYQERLKHLISEQKKLSISDDKFQVILGTITYALKIFNELVDCNLGDGVLGRNAFRTTLESYVNLKYLILLEKENSNVWKEYKFYGIGKYKFALLKNRENQESGTIHFNEPLIDAIVNEDIWEEFISIDPNFFDKKSIKEKFKEVGELQLYETCYEYDNNFVHGFWGAVRESSMLHCNNASHRYHSTPDVTFQQKMPCVYSDIKMIMDKLSNILDEEFSNENQ